MVGSRSAAVNSKPFIQGLVFIAGLLGLVAAHADGDPVPMLIDKLQTSDSYLVRTQAAAILGRIGDDRAEQALIVRLREDSSYAVRGASAGALGHIGGGRVVGPLFQALDDEDSVVRELARKALLSVQGPGVTDALRVHIFEGNAKERAIACERLTVLTQAGDADAASVLLEALPSSSQRDQIEAAVAALPPDKARQVLLPALASDEPELQLTAVRMLATHQQPEVLDALIVAYNRTGEDEQVKQALRQSLHSRRAQFDIPLLITQAKGEDRSIKARAVRLLALCDDANALRTLLDLLKSDEPFVQGTVALALADADLRIALPQVKDLRGRCQNQRLQSILDAVIARLSK